jgi:hypothetical protein
MIPQISNVTAKAEEGRALEEVAALAGSRDREAIASRYTVKR